MSGTKEKMAEAFKNLVCKKSFQKITITDISKECGMTRENFYYHFRDKFDILRWIYEQEVVAKLPSEEDPFEEWLFALIHLTCKNYKFYRKVAKAMGMEQIRKEMQPIFMKRLIILIDKSLDDSVWNMRQEKEEFAAAFFTDAFIGFFVNYILDHENLNEDFVQINLSFLFQHFLSFVRNERVDFSEEEKQN